jgi:hypothetical protein
MIILGLHSKISVNVSVTGLNKTKRINLKK